MMPHKRATCCRVMLSLLLFPLIARAWPGHTWEEWKKETTWARPEIRTDQAGKPELAPLLRTDAGQPIDEIRAWETKRGQYAECIRAILGSPAGELKPPSPQAEVLGEERLDGYVRRHIRIRSEADDWIPAYLLIPVKAEETGWKPVPQEGGPASGKDKPVPQEGQPAPRDGGPTPGKRTPVPQEGRPASQKDRSVPHEPGRRPTMICVHQTVSQGKDEPCGIKGDPQLAFALQLVQRGFVCIAPDMIGFGERIPAGAQPYHDSAAFYRKHPGWSYMGKMVWDMSRIVDYLRTLPEVDPLQIGSIGHSHGAYTTLFTAAFEPRISLAIASCGFTTLRSDPRPDRWSHLTALIPQIGTYLPQVNEIPFDFQHVCSLVAPRPLFVWYATRDTIFPNTDNLDAMFNDVRGVYGLYGAADDLKWNAFDGEHKFPDDGRAMAYDWLDERFFQTGDPHAVPTDLVDWQQHRQLLRRVILRSICRPFEETVALDLKVLAAEPQSGYERRLIEYTVQPGERVRAYLCIPTNASGRLPGVLVLHQTAAEGKDESVGLRGNRSFAFASDLAARGYVTLAPDSITAGERVDAGKPFDTRVHYQRHPDLSAMGKMLHDARRALDVLAGLEQVDPRRIAAIGHSLGAEEALMLAAFDERVMATVASCGYATFAAEKNRTRWARDQWFSYMPKLRPVFQRGDLPAWDWPDVVRLIAPRGLYQHTTEQDEIFTESVSAYEAGQVAEQVWQLFGATDRFVNVLKPGKHAIADETRREMYEWLDRQLGK